MDHLGLGFLRQTQFVGSLSLWSTIWTPGRLNPDLWDRICVPHLGGDPPILQNGHDKTCPHGWRAISILNAEDLSCLSARFCCWYAGCAAQKTDDMLKEDHGILVLWGNRPRSFVALLLLFWTTKKHQKFRNFSSSWPFEGTFDEIFGSDVSTPPLLRSIWGVVWPHHLAAHCTEFHRLWWKHGGHGLYPWC